MLQSRISNSLLLPPPCENTPAVPEGFALIRRDSVMDTPDDFPAGVSGSVRFGNDALGKRGRRLRMPPPSLAYECLQIGNVAFSKGERDNALIEMAEADQLVQAECCFVDRRKAFPAFDPNFPLM